MDQYPKHAEQHTKSDYTKRSVVPSKILRGKMIEGPDACHCPRCDRVFPAAWEHGVKDRCTSCNLFTLTFGNALYIWEHP
jgi:hypothetical protein